MTQTDLAHRINAIQNTAEVIATVYLVVKKGLLDAYRQHPAVTWSDFDNPTVKVAEKLIANTEKQVTWAETFLPTIAANYPGWETWRDYIAGLLAADGGGSWARESRGGTARPSETRRSRALPAPGNGVRSATGLPRSRTRRVLPAFTRRRWTLRFWRRSRTFTPSLMTHNVAPSSAPAGRPSLTRRAGRRARGRSGSSRDTPTADTPPAPR